MGKENKTKKSLNIKISDVLMGAACTYLYFHLGYNGLMRIILGKDDKLESIKQDIIKDREKQK